MTSSASIQVRSLSPLLGKKVSMLNVWMDKNFSSIVSLMPYFPMRRLHWMTDPEAVIGGVYRALKPSGRFVGEFGGRGNVACIVEALSQTLLEYEVDPEPLKSLVFSLSRRIRRAPKRRWPFDKVSNFVSTSNNAIG